MVLKIRGIYTGIHKKTQYCTIENITVPLSYHRAIYCFITHRQRNANAGKLITNVRWDSSGSPQYFTYIGHKEQSKSICEIYRLITPKEITATLMVKFNSTDSNWNGSIIGAVILSGVCPENPDSDFTVNGNSSGTSSLTLLTKKDKLNFAISDANNVQTMTGEGTLKWNRNSGGTCRGAGVSFIAIDNQSNFSFTHSVCPWSMIGLNINAHPYVIKEINLEIKRDESISLKIERDIYITTII